MKLTSFKFWLAVSLLCHAAGFAAYEWLAAPAAPHQQPPAASPPVVIFTTETDFKNFSAPAPGQVPPKNFDPKFSKLFAAANSVALKHLPAAAAAKALAERKAVARLAPGETDLADAAGFAENATNDVIVGTRLTRVYAVANIQPEYFKNPPPEYPAEARRLRQEGIVWLRVHVTNRGHPDRVSILRSSGFALLDAAAVDAVQTWDFNPAQLGETLVEAEIDFPIQFRLP